MTFVFVVLIFLFMTGASESADNDDMVWAAGCLFLALLCVWGAIRL